MIGPWTKEFLYTLPTPQLSGAAQYVKLPYNAALSLSATEVLLDKYPLKELSKTELMIHWQRCEDVMDLRALGTLILISDKNNINVVFFQ